MYGMRSWMVYILTGGGGGGGVDRGFEEGRKYYCDQDNWIGLGQRRRVGDSDCGWGIWGNFNFYCFYLWVGLFIANQFFFIFLILLIKIIIIACQLSEILSYKRVFKNNRGGIKNNESTEV